MSSNTVNVKINVTDGGGTTKLTDGAILLKNTWDGVATSAAKASKAINSSSVPSKASTSAPKYSTAAATPVTQEDYGRTRGAVGTGAAGRDFAKQSQGLGGLVGLYATFAANIFAVGAAYEALNKAAAAERLSKATALMSAQVGVNLKSVSNNLIEASGNALSFQDAMQFTNIGTSAGLAGKQIESLTKIARGAASALGRDVNDSVRRIIQGTAKQEQEILDELGIFVKSKQAFDKYAQQIGVKVEDLTGRQRTQAYANEVERLGEKWKEFAEIDDPFSKFAATGKNALNELLTGVNAFIKPVLSFLSESKSGIQAIITLVTLSLTKRALPEIGGLLNNLFTYDKKAAQAKASEAQAIIKAANDAIIADFNAANAKLGALKAQQAKLVIPTSTKETAVASLGTAASTLGKNKEYGISPVKVANLINSNTGTDTLLNTQKSITKVLEDQLKATKHRDEMLKGLIDKGIVEKTSIMGKLVLDKEGLVVADKVFASAEAKNKALATQLALTEKINLAEKDVAKLGKAVEKIPEDTSTAVNTSIINKNTAAKTANNIASETSLVTSKVRSVTVAAETVALITLTTTEARLLAVREAAVAGALAQNAAAAGGLKGVLISTIAAMKGIIAAGYGEAMVANAAKTGLFSKASSLAAGTVQGIKNAIVAVSIASPSAAAIVSGSMTAIGGTSVAASVGVKLLGAAFKGLIATVSALAMPVLALWTVWELFGDKIAKFLPESVQTALGIGKIAEAAKSAEEKQKAYNESLEISTKNLAMLADMKASGKVENLAEEADLEERIAKSLKERISLTTEAAAKAKVESEANKRRSEEISKWGRDFSEAALNARELARILELANQPELAKQARDIATEYNLLNTNFRAGVIDKEEYAKRLDIIKEKEAANLNASSRAEEQRSSNASKASTSLKSMEEALDKVTIANRKLGDATQGLKSGEAVDFYTNFTNILDKSGNSATGVAGMFSILSSSIASGGKTAALAIPIMAELAAVYRGLIEANVGPKVVEATLATYIAKVVDPQIKALSNSVTTSKSGGKVKEYTEDAKKGFRDIEHGIESAKLQQIKLDKEFANTSAIQKRNDAVLGYQSAETNALEKSNALRKNEAELVNTIANSYSTLRKTLDSKTRSPEEKVGAVATYAKDVNTAAATKDAADQNAELTYQANTTSTALSALSKSYELLNLQQANSAAQRDALFELNELDIQYKNELAGLSDSEIVRETYAATVRKATYDQLKATTVANEEHNRAVDKAMTMDGDFTKVSEELIRLGKLKEEGLIALAIKYGITTEAAKKLADAETQKIADRSDWVKGAVTGLKDYEKSAKDVAGSVSGVFSKAFKGMEDALTDFVMTGKLDFASLANSIISDMMRIMIQQSITAPLAGAMSGAMNGIGSFVASLFAADGAAFSSGGIKAMAKGGAYEQGAQAFAKGGSFTNSIVSSPTLFKFANGTGLMGEAGPEAIMPLKRDANGTLGVRTNALQQQGNNVTINIIESPEKAGTQERTTNNGTDMITIFVEKVKSAIASDISRGSGVVPNALSRTYGLNRSAGAY